MRRIAFTLAATALFSLGATSSTDCFSSLLPILTPRLTASIHVINDAYQPVTVELLVGGASSTSLMKTDAGPLAVDDTDDSTDEEAETDSTVDAGEDLKIGTTLCAAIVGPISLKATYKDSSNSEISATSSSLYLDNDFACGDRVNFIIRPAAMVGIVVGYEVEPGAAD